MSQTSKPQNTSIIVDNRPRLSNPTLVVHNGGFAEVHGQAEMNLKAGVQDVEVLDLPNQNSYVPGSLSVDGPDDVTELASSYRAPNLTSGSLAGDLLNTPVTAYQNGQFHVKGTLLSQEGKTVVLKVDGKPVTLHDVYKVEYCGVPGHLANQPLVQLTLDSKEAGKKTVDLKLQTNNLSWSRSYEAILDRTAGTIDLKGNVLLQNHTGVDWHGATVILVQGETGNALQQDSYGYESVRAFSAAAAPRMPKGGSTVSDTGDVKTYLLDGTYELRNGQSKKVPFTTIKGLKAEVEYRLDLATRWWHAAGRSNGKRPVRSVLKFKGAAGETLSIALPSGTFTVREKGEASLRALQAGQGHLEDLPLGEEAAIDFTQAFDLVAEVKVTNVVKLKPEAPQATLRPAVFNPPDRQELLEHAVEQLDNHDEDADADADEEQDEKKKYEVRTCEVKLTNRSKRNVTVKVEELFDSYGELHLDGGKLFTRVDGGKHQAAMTVEAGKDAVISYAVKVPVN